jgi:hypothetical protein
MTQAQLDAAVARATGESHATIRSLGFSLVTPLQEPEHRARAHHGCAEHLVSPLELRRGLPTRQGMPRSLES